MLSPVIASPPKERCGKRATAGAVRRPPRPHPLPAWERGSPRGSRGSPGSGSGRRFEAVGVFVAPGREPAGLRRPPPELLKRVARIGSRQELLARLRHVGLRALRDRVGAERLGPESGAFRRIEPGEPGVGL